MPRSFSCIQGRRADPKLYRVPETVVFKVRVRADDLVDQVEFHVSGEPYVVKTYGGNGGRQCADFDLGIGEWLAAVLRRQALNSELSSSLNAVLFETNTGRLSQWYGNPYGGHLMPRLVAPPGQTIVGLVRPSDGFCPGVQDITTAPAPL